VTGVPVTREVADGVFACEQPDGPRIIRQVVVAGSARALVVDTGLPGSPAVGILPLLGRLGLEPVVLLTHPDGDHVAGTGEILAAHPGARVLAGGADVPLIGDPERAIRERYARFSVEDDVPFGEPQVARARARFGAAFPAPEPAADGAVVDLGGRRVALLATPGHSPGHTAAWLSTDGVLIAADAVMGRAITDSDGNPYIPPMYAPPAAYRTTIARLADLDRRLLLTGHEPVMDGPASDAFLAASLAACDRFAAVTAAALDDLPATLATLCGRVREAYGGLPADRTGELALTVDGHLQELVVAGAAAVEPGPPRTFRRLR
jgi:glyoxylase-like metal-dependent hydrolase (beta-lactamase superfamily II)